MKKRIAVFYGSSTGNTERVANLIKEFLPHQMVDIINITLVRQGDMELYKNIIFGVSTWGLAELQHDWESFIAKLENADLANKVVALYGLGNQYTYPDNFADALGYVYDIVSEKNCRIVGLWPTDNYNFINSRALQDNRFVGLVIDEDGEPEKTPERVKNWLEVISEEFI